MTKIAIYVPVIRYIWYKFQIFKLIKVYLKMYMSIQAKTLNISIMLILRKTFALIHLHSYAMNKGNRWGICILFLIFYVQVYFSLTSSSYYIHFYKKNIYMLLLISHANKLNTLMLHPCILMMQNNSLWNNFRTKI